MTAPKTKAMAGKNHGSEAATSAKAAGLMGAKGGSGMNQRQALIAETSIDGEVSCVHGDDFGAWTKFGEHNERSVTRVHLRIFFKEISCACSMHSPDWHKIEQFFRNLADERTQRFSFRLQQVARFTKDQLGREYGFVESRDDLLAPRVPLVTQRKSAHQWSGIDQISNRRSLHASKDRAVRS